MTYKSVFLKNKLIGRIDKENKIYVSLRTSEHIFRKYGDGFGISMDVLRYLEENEIDTIIINFENIRAYITDINRFYFHGIEYDFFEDKQLILPIQYFKEKK
jgi:hypothetical protein